MALGPNEFIAKMGSDAEKKEMARSELLARIPQSVTAGLADVDSIRANSPTRLKREDHLAVALLDAHAKRILRLPKNVQDAAKLAIKLAENGGEVTALKETYAEAVATVRQEQKRYLAEQALSGELPDQWNWEFPVDLPDLSENQIELSVAAIREAKHDAEQKFRGTAKYEIVYPLLVDAYAEIVQFYNADGFDKATISAAEFEKLSGRALEAAIVLRSINESYWTGDHAGRKAINEISKAQDGLAHVGDYRRHQIGILSESEVRTGKGDEAVRPEIKTVGDLQKEARAEQAEAEKAEVAERKKIAAKNAQRRLAGANA